MKRITVLVVVGLLAIAVRGFALKGTPDLAVGAEVTTINFGGVGAMLTLHVPGVPLYFGLGADLFGDFTLATTVDTWLLHKQITGPLEFSIGVGVCGALSFDPTWYAFGVRAPIALQLWPLGTEQLELFLEVAPAWVPVTGAGFTAGNVQAQCALGFRLWF
jgi:hypothetical protein